MSPLPGWYRDPAAPETQRYWDGEQWIGTPLPAEATPPPGPPAETPPAPSQAIPDLVPPAGGTRSGMAPQAPAAPPASPGALDAPNTPHPPGAQHTPGAPTTPQAPSAPDTPPVPPGHVRIAGTSQVVPVDTDRLASLGSRILARVIDVVVVFLLSLVVNGYFFAQLSDELGPVLQAIAQGQQQIPETSDNANQLILMITGITLALWFACEVPGTANSGQTLGKRLVGIRVERALDNKTLTFGQSLRRWLILALPSPVASICGLPLQLADLLWCLWDRPGRQCLHDKAVASLVVRVPPQPSPPPPGPL